MGKVPTTPITTLDQWRTFVAAMLDRVGGGFHPDNYAHDYRDDHGHNVFTRAEALSIDLAIGSAFKHIPAETIYDTALEMMRERMGV